MHGVDAPIAFEDIHKEHKLSTRRSFVLGVCSSASILSACGTTVAELSKPDSQTYFILQKDHYRTLTRGLMNVPWVEGLRAGTYEAAGKDAQGTYYIGSGACVITLAAQFADAYLRTGVLPPVREGGGALLGAHPGYGGLFIPHDLEKDAPKLIVINKMSSGGLGVLTYAALKAAIEDTMSLIDYGSEKQFVRGIQVQMR
jgi:hypothetical protein